MPFPLLKLPYGSRQRLRELSTPTEVYDLQLAFGDDLSGLLPLLPVHPKLNMTIVSDGTQLIGSEDGIDSTKNLVYDVVMGIIIRITTTNTFNNAIFDNLYIKDTFSMTIYDDCLFEPLKLIAPSLLNVKELVLERGDEKNQNTKLSQLITIFPKIEELIMPQLHHGWVKDLLKANKPGFKVKIIGQTTFAVIHSFMPEDMAQLLKNRCVIYVLCDINDNEMDKIKSEITAYLQPHLVLDQSYQVGASVVDDFYNGSLDRQLVIQLNCGHDVDGIEALVFTASD